MARYLKNSKTGEVKTVADDDDATFYELIAERDEDSRHVWSQTGAHDPAVPVHVPGTLPTVPLPEEAPQPTAEQIDAVIADRYPDAIAPAEPAKKPAAAKKTAE